MKTEISFEEAINLLRQVKETAKYMKTFQCDNPSNCGKGAICNSCWVRNWAIDFLKKSLTRLARSNASKLVAV